jgi:hypothetical protein
MPFENWSAGEELFKNLDKEVDLIDRDIRPFVEECDQMQGFQLFTGADDAWGGFAAQYLDNMLDEYGKKSIWIWAVEDTSRTTRVINAIDHSAAGRRTNYQTGKETVTDQQRRKIPSSIGPACISLHPSCLEPSQSASIRQSDELFRMDNNSPALHWLGVMYIAYKTECWRWQTVVLELA